MVNIFYQRMLIILGLVELSPYSEESKRVINYILADDLPAICWLTRPASCSLDVPGITSIILISLCWIWISGQTTYQDACTVAWYSNGYWMNSIFAGQNFWCHRSALPRSPGTMKKFGIHPPHAEIVVELIPDQATVIRQVKNGNLVCGLPAECTRQNGLFPSVRVPHAPVSPLFTEEVPGSSPLTTIRAVLPPPASNRGSLPRCWKIPSHCKTPGPVWDSPTN